MLKKFENKRRVWKLNNEMIKAKCVELNELVFHNWITELLCVRRMVQLYKIYYNKIKSRKDEICIMVRCMQKAPGSRGEGTKYIVRDQRKEMTGSEMYETIKGGTQKEM